MEKMNVEPASYIKSDHYQWLENKQLNDLCNEIFDNYKLYVRCTIHHVIHAVDLFTYIDSDIYIFNVISI